ncbi:MAG: hypothetical protein RLZ44_1664 [Pseudomonadota bacterium]|jgi:CHAD domain-containing protein
MHPTQYPGFLLPPNFTLRRLTDRLGKAVPLLEDEQQQIERLYLDTFDWRLHDGGVVLFEKRVGRDAALWLQDLAEEHTLTSVRCDRTPAWPADIPAGELQQRVGKLAAMRILLPLVRVRSRAHLLRVLNEDQKTVVRLRVEEVRCDAQGLDEPRALLPRVRLIPVRGYAEESAAVARLLREDLELPEAPRALLEEALAAIGRHPGDYSSKLNVRLHGQRRADVALRKICLHLLDTLERNVDGARRDLDPEFLHDLRVATRRTRSALTQVKEVLPMAVLEDFKERFAWLGQETGPTRDLDVFLLEFPRYRDSLPAALRADLEPLHEFLQTHQRQEQKALRRRLDSPQFQRLLQDWRDYLESELDAAPAAARALQPIQAVAGRRIWRMFRRVLKEGRAIADDSPHEDLHELRKSCKKLRYLIEFFQSLYPDDELKPLLKALKRLLDNLGEFQDLEVQSHQLQAFAAGMQQEGKVPLGTLLAIGALVGDLLHRQERARAAFHDCFAAFDTGDNRAVYRRLFKPVSAETPA